MFLLAVCLLPGRSIVSASPVSEPSLLTLMQDVKSAIRQAQARYDSGNVTGAADLARKILAKYPDNADAKAILDQCIATEREEYEKAVGSMSVTELTNFQKKYPESEYGIDVSKRIADLPFWLDAKDKNTLNSYEQYLSESIHQMYKRDADDAIAELTVKQAYDAAVAANTIKAFEQFRSKYPDSAYDKQASNKIARLMADKFNSRSTYTDKNNALAYAKNEMTRDYVNNKYNKATEKKYNSSSTSTYSNSTYSSNRNNSSSSTSSSTAGVYRNTRVDSDKSIRLGIGFLGDFGMHSQYAGDLWYDSYPYSLGLSVLIRFGDQRKPINFITGIKALWSNANTKYTSWEGYGSYDYTDKTRVNEVVIPLEMNWNFLSHESIGMYLGIGYQLGTSSSRAIKFSFGVPWTHGDWNIYYIKYTKSPFHEDTGFTPYIGTSYTYYF